MAARGMLRVASLSSTSPLQLLLLILLPLTAMARELRCDAICNFEDLREQCERCRLRYPMRFGKRSSPPENESPLPANVELSEGIIGEEASVKNHKLPTTVSRSTAQYLAEALLWPRRLRDVSDSSNSLKELLVEVAKQQRAPRSFSLADEQEAEVEAEVIGSDHLLRRRKRSPVAEKLPKRTGSRGAGTRRVAGGKGPWRHLFSFSKRLDSPTPITSAQLSSRKNLSH